MRVTDILMIMLDCFVKNSNHKILVWSFSHVLGQLKHIGYSKHRFVFTLKCRFFFFSTVAVLKIRLNTDFTGDFPGGPMTEILCSQFRGPGLNPWSGN